MFRLIVFVLALAFAPPASAQIILDDETPDGGGQGGDGGLDFPGCDACCATNPAWYCEGEYGCHCDDFGFCGSASAMRAAGVSEAEIKTLQISLATLGAKLLTSTSGRQTARLWLTYDDRIYQILRDDPALGGRVSKLMTTYWPKDADFGAKGGSLMSTPVPKEAIAELRGILRDIARADSGKGTTGLAHVITADVLPKLPDGLAGRPYAEALTCYLDGC